VWTISAIFRIYSPANSEKSASTCNLVVGQQITHILNQVRTPNGPENAFEISHERNVSGKLECDAISCGYGGVFFSLEKSITNNRANFAYFYL
jgi:hypothetical protein